MEQFDYKVYKQKMLVAVQFDTVPKPLNDMPAVYGIFQRVTIPEVKKIFAEKMNFIARMLGAKKFETLLNERMGYWEKKIPTGQHCFVHYARGSEEEINAAYDKLKKDSDSFALVGVYHIEPQVSLYPFGFPFEQVPSTWFLGKHFDFTKDSVFWFNFFPDQKDLFAKTFEVWLIFNVIKMRMGVETNQLVFLDDQSKLMVNGLEKFVQVNLNRFTNFEGFLKTASEAGGHTFTHESNYIWYGMLLKHYKA